MANKRVFEDNIRSPQTQDSSLDRADSDTHMLFSRSLESASMS